MKKFLIIMVLISFAYAKNNKITVSIYCKAYHKKLKSQAKDVNKMIRQIVPPEMVNYIPAKNTLSVMRKFYKGVKPTATYLFKSFKIKPNFRKWLQERQVDYLIISGINVSRKTNTLILFYRILPVGDSKEETKFIRTKTWKEMQSRVSESLNNSILAKRVTELQSSKNNRGWFNEEMPSGLTKSKTPGLYTWEKDQSAMVYVSKGKFKNVDQEVPGFYIDKYEVNNQQFCTFLNDQKPDEIDEYIKSPHSLIQENDGVYTPKQGSEFYPIVEVSWLGAKEYCKWAGKNLPSTTQWQKSFRGGTQIPQLQNKSISLVENPLPQRTFPWGSDSPDKFVYRCNYHPEKANADGFAWLAPTIAFDGLGDSPYFCSNMLGNVWEWSENGENDQQFCYGGSWNSSMEMLQKPIEVSTETTKNDIGFRSVLQVE
ncbi:formylglycine-generating enzyme family protein [Candidatus Uabimicrobium sp. HlEnr_7]|uniref:formylglycine-generating enzyme family protein n=1 Tax=Candidatus Uabimicrobium helgolandensis TaxID=3095367 RepID=UPI00355888C7